MPILKFFLSAIMLFVTLSNPVKIFAQQNTNGAIVVLNENQAAPLGAVSKGHIKLGYEAFKLKCDYETIISQAKEKARKMGGYIIKITKSANPDLWNTCYRIKADILFYENIDKLAIEEESKNDSISKSLIPDTAHFALLYIYRPASLVGAPIGYNIHLGKDSIVCRARNGSKYIIKVFKEGPTEIWGATESRSVVNPDIKFGEVYFIKCTIKMGVMVGEPSLHIMSNKKGLEEFNDIEFNAREKIKDDVY